MILDSLEHGSRYAALGPAFARAFVYLAGTRLENLTDGRQEIDGDTVYALVSSYQTADAETKKLEAHRLYADIQVVVQGEETLLWAPLQGLHTDVDYRSDKDVAFFRVPAEPATPVHLRPGLFALLLPWDAHAPGCSLRRAQAVRKVVIKVRV